LELIRRKKKIENKFSKNKNKPFNAFGGALIVVNV